MKDFLLTFIAVFFMGTGMTLSLNAQSSQIPSADSLYADTLRTEEPVPLNLAEVMKQVVYPEDARYDEIEGKVIIKVLVGFTGTVEELGQITGPTIFYKEVRRVAVMLRFSPGKYNGELVKVWIMVPFNFQIKKDK